MNINDLNKEISKVSKNLKGSFETFTQKFDEKQDKITENNKLDYALLSGDIPEIPSAVSQLENDSGYITEDAISGKLDTEDYLEDHTEIETSLNNVINVLNQFIIVQPNNEIWYWAQSQVTLYSSADVIEHTFADGKGILKFASNVTTTLNWFRATGITNVSLPDTVTSIGEKSFYGCSSLLMIELNSGITSIGRLAFYECPNLALTELPSGITEIGERAFYGCSNLALTEIPSGITTIYAGTFWICSSLTSLTFLGTPTSIDGSTFNGSSNLIDIYVPWSQGDVANAPWGATNATIHYNSVN